MGRPMGHSEEGASLTQESRGRAVYLHPEIPTPRKGVDGSGPFPFAQLRAKDRQGLKALLKWGPPP